MENIVSKGCLDNTYLKTLDEEEREFIITLLFTIQIKLINHSFDFDEDESGGAETKRHNPPRVVDVSNSKVPSAPTSKLREAKFSGFLDFILGKNHF